MGVSPAAHEHGLLAGSRRRVERHHMDEPGPGAGISASPSAKTSGAFKVATFIFAMPFNSFNAQLLGYGLSSLRPYNPYPGVFAEQRHGVGRLGVAY